MNETLLALPEPGIYKFDISEESQKSRLHLRVDEDLSGLLVINASRIIYLNQSALLMAYLYLNKVDQSEAIDTLLDRFEVQRATFRQIMRLLLRKSKRWSTKTAMTVLFVISVYLLICPFLPNQARPIAWTWQSHTAVTTIAPIATTPAHGTILSSSTTEWKKVIDKLWEIRIPHVVFTGGEPTLRNDLPELVAYADQKGMVTGINTNGTRLGDQAFLNSLVEAGLDHVQITLESHDAQIHDQMVRRTGAWQKTLAGLRNVVNRKLYVMTNTTLLNNNAGALRETLEFLASEGVPTVGFNA